MKNNHSDIPYSRIFCDKKDIKAVVKTIKKGLSKTSVQNIEKLEEKITEYTGTKYAVTFNSGTSALFSCILAHQIGQGDEVIIPSFTFIATANACVFAGAKPVFADIEKESFGLAPKEVEKKITKKTKAIIAVHYGGCPCKINELRKIAKRHDLILIEDAAEALGAKVNKKMIGNFGNGAIFSFAWNKIISTGEGGCAVTNNKNTYKKLKLIRYHGRTEKKSGPDYIRLGFNFKMSGITAAFGLSQFEKIKENIKIRKKIAIYFNEKMSKLKEEIELPPLLFNTSNTYQMYPILVKQKTRDRLKIFLRKKGITARIYFRPLHLTYFYKNKLSYKNIKLEITDSLSKKILNLPIYATMQKREIDYIVKQITNFLKN